MRAAKEPTELAIVEIMMRWTGAAVDCTFQPLKEVSHKQLIII